jgi:hypothetical protein
LNDQNLIRQVKKLKWKKYVIGFGIGFVVLFFFAESITQNFPDYAGFGWTLFALYFFLVAFYLKYKVDM